MPTRDYRAERRAYYGYGPVLCDSSTAQTPPGDGVEAAGVQGGD